MPLPLVLPVALAAAGSALAGVLAERGGPVAPAAWGGALAPAGACFCTGLLAECSAEAISTSPDAPDPGGASCGDGQRSGSNGRGGQRRGRADAARPAAHRRQGAGEGENACWLLVQRSREPSESEQRATTVAPPPLPLIAAQDEARRRAIPSRTDAALAAPPSLGRGRSSPAQRVGASEQVAPPLAAARLLAQ